MIKHFYCYVVLAFFITGVLLSTGCIGKKKSPRKKRIKTFARKVLIDKPKQALSLAKRMAYAKAKKAVVLLKELRQYGHTAIVILRDMLKAKDWRERTRAAWALGKLGAVAAIDELIDRVDDKARHVRDAALFALKKLTGKDFGRNKSCWREWWEKNKNRVLSENK